ncbi:MAG: family 16 glycosylhydrolase [Gammaproteobacteria bacterium]|nr:family 16 glycosylhydrolase [Gammaproteobacteria bacterium]MBU1653731.1 family 16 glycosylhydrolase [Gammaproteobacteria bacterium]MBU1959608.1 family 16 glycosylhydrolase [Gammaproteobacteria bacterium]
MTIRELLAGVQTKTISRGSLKNDSLPSHFTGTTGTSLDRLVDLIGSDLELNRRIPTSEIAEAARAADALNSLLVEAIKATGVANDGWINAADLHEVNAYIRNDAGLLARWTALHGDDEATEETGFHLVQNDGAVTRLFGQNAVNSVLDGIYHLGFEVKNGRLMNEDGSANVSLAQAADWLNGLLADDLKAGSLKNPAIDPYAQGSTGTGLDKLVEMIAADDSLNQRLSTREITTGARAADEMNKILVEAIKATGAADDGAIGLTDMRDISAYIRTNHQAQWTALHGDDEATEETGFHLVQNDGAVTRLFGENAVNTVADAIYHMGFEIRYGRYLNEDGNSNQRVETVMEWLNDLLREDLKAGSLKADPVTIDESALEAAIVLALDDVTVDGSPAWRQPSTHAEIDNPAALKLTNGTIAFGFTADNPASSATQALFSKDQNGDGNGELMAFLRSGKLYVKVQHEGRSTYLDSGEIQIEAGQRYDLAVSFGDGGLQVYLNGQKIANDPQLEFNWNHNDADLVVGASGQWRNDSTSTGTWYHFDGTIEDLSVYNRALNRAEVAHINQAGPLPVFQAGTAAVAAAARPDLDAGTGLLGEIFDRSNHFSSVTDLESHIASLTAPTHSFDAKAIDFGNRTGDGNVAGFLGANGSLTSGNASTAMESIGIRLSGYIYLEAGEHRITVRSDDGYVLKLGGEVFSSHQSPRPFYATSKDGDFDGGLYQIEMLYYENGGGQGLRLEIDGEIVGAEYFYRSIDGFNDALATHGPAPAEAAAANDGAPALADVELAAVYAGTGLSGQAFDSNRGFNSIGELQDFLAIADASHSFTASQIDFGGANQRGNIAGFLGDSAQLTSGDGSTAMETVAVRLSGYVYIPAGEHHITVRSDDGYLLKLGGQEFSSFESPRPFYATDKAGTFAGGLYAIELLYYENWGAEGLRLELDGQALGAEHFYQSVADFQQALADNGPMPEGGLPEQNPLPQGTTGTGLDKLIELIVNDPNLPTRASEQDIRDGAQAANALNALIVEAIKATGVANDGQLTASDMHDLNAYIQANHQQAWIALHGDDETNEETGYHKVQNDGAVTRLFGDNALDTVADGLYHIGFDITGDRFKNEDGNANARLETTAYWLNQLLAKELQEGSLKNQAIDPEIKGTTGTGLDRLVDLINGDSELERRISNEDIREGAAAANAMNALLIEAIKATGVANNGQLNAADIYSINAYLRANHLEEWNRLHGDDEANEETGFHNVQNDGSVTRMYDNNAIDTVIDGIYHLGYEIKHGRVLNEDGNYNQTLDDLAVWLNDLLKADLADGSLKNDQVTPYLSGTTGTGLDQLVSLIQADVALNQSISRDDIREGAKAADAMNAIILEAIQATGIANDGRFTASDMYDLNAYIQGRYTHGADGPALIEDGLDAFDATTWRLSDWSNGGYFANDWSPQQVAFDNGYMNLSLDQVNGELLSGEYQSVDTYGHGLYQVSLKVSGVAGTITGFFLYNGAPHNEIDIEIKGDDPTKLQVNYITDGIEYPSVIDLGFDASADFHTYAFRWEGDRITWYVDGVGVHSENGDSGALPIHPGKLMINLWGAEGTGTWSSDYDYEASGPAVAQVDQIRYIPEATDFSALWNRLHGDDEANEETGFHRVQNDGAVTRLFGENAVNTVADSLYHMGYDIRGDRFLNEDGNNNARLETTAYWLNQLLAKELQDGSLKNQAIDPEDKGSTGTGLDQLVDLINDDSELERRISNEDIREAAMAADGMNTIIAEAIQQTGLGNDGVITASDVYDLNAYILANYETEWKQFHGDDGANDETGFHRVQNDGAVTRLFDQNAINTVADGIYHMGFQIQNGRFLNEDGNANVSVEQVAVWLDTLLHGDLTAGIESYISGGCGDDRLVGTEGADQFLFAPASGEVVGNDQVVDFSQAQGDRILIGNEVVSFRFDYLDSNGDGLDDYTLLSLYAGNQASLGTVAVQDNLLSQGDVVTLETPFMGLNPTDPCDIV